MARTAPIPNIPAIPGMCPGLAVLGGGAGSGGKGGKGAGSGDGGVGAEGEGGAENTDGDGRSGSDGCGSSRSARCAPHPGAGSTRTAGDPVDVITGRVFTIPKLDVAVHGPIPFIFRRQYSSHSIGRDIGLGAGWCHTLAWEVEETRRKLKLWGDDGRWQRFPRLDVGQSVIGRRGMRLRHERNGYVADHNDVWLRFERASADGKRWLLTSIGNRNRQRISLEYEREQLSGVVDAAGRRYEIGRTRCGRISSIRCETPNGTITLVRYGYDDGDLASVTSGDGFATLYQYREHLLERQVDPDGFALHYVYDARGRCIETWGDQGGRPDPGLAPDAPELLADGRTVAKGVLHCKIDFHGDGYVEVADSKQVTRYSANDLGEVTKEVTDGAVTEREFDDNGFERLVTDPSGFTTTYEPRGRLLAMTDRLGARKFFRRNDDGRVVEQEDALGNVTQFAYDADGNMLRRENPDGTVSSYTYRNGFLIEVSNQAGGKTTAEWDQMGNILSVTQPNGATWRASYDYLGRRTKIISSTGDESIHTYDLAGAQIATTHPDGGVTHRRFNGSGRLIEEIGPDGGATRFDYGCYYKICRVTKANGLVIVLHYDRENKPRRILNQRNEAHELEVDARGYLVGERDYRGEETTYRYNAFGCMVRATNALGQVTDLSYDAEGRLIRKEYDEEVVHEFSYDALGNLASATAPAAKLVVETDEFGRRKREVVELCGEKYITDVAHDPFGNIVSLKTSLGHEWKREVDATGYATAEHLDQAVVRYGRDPKGRIVRMTLPTGGAIDMSWDAQNRLVRQQVLHSQDGILVDIGYEYTAGGSLLNKHDSELGGTTYTRDSIRQLTTVEGPDGIEERFSYDETGNLFGGGRDAPERRYEGGDLLVRHGNTRLVYDPLGRLEAKYLRPDDGVDESWLYFWDPTGMLRRAECSDGRAVDFEYDALFRRVVKRVWKRQNNGIFAQVSEIRYIWFEFTVIHELVVDASGTVERTYAYRSPDAYPVAQRERRVGEVADQDGSWVFFLHDLGGYPSRLLKGDGSVVEELRHRSFGALEGEGSTVLRFLGQSADDETGLFYNLYRYYDPSVGRYISPDPIGLAGGFNLYRYVDNQPDLLADPDGLGCLVTIRGQPGTPMEGRQVQSGSMHTGDLPPGADYQSPQTSTVQQAVADTVQGSTIYPPGTCAEPSALDKFLQDAREQPGNEGKTDQELLEQIDNEGIDIRHHDNASAPNTRAPCPNCKQILQNAGDIGPNDRRLAVPYNP